MFISVVIPYSGKKKKLFNKCVENVYKQLRGVIVNGRPVIRDEIIIVNDSDGTVDRWNEFAIKLPYDSKDNNLVAARNFGVHYAKNQIIVFLDEDMLPEPALLETYRSLIPQIHICCGRIEWISSGTQTIMDYRLKIEDIAKRGGNIKFPLILNKLSNIGMGGGGNFAISKALFSLVGGFSLEYNRYWGAEDIDLFRKCQEARYNIYYHYKAMAIHQKHKRDLVGNQRNHDIFKKKWGIEKVEDIIDAI